MEPRRIARVDPDPESRGPLAHDVGDMGSEVIKVDAARHRRRHPDWGPPFVGNAACYFLGRTANKRGSPSIWRMKRGQKNPGRADTAGGKS